MLKTLIWIGMKESTARDQLTDMCKYREEASILTYFSVHHIGTQYMYFM